MLRLTINSLLNACLYSISYNYCSVISSQGKNILCWPPLQMNERDLYSFISVLQNCQENWIAHWQFILLPITKIRIMKSLIFYIPIEKNHSLHVSSILHSCCIMYLYVNLNPRFLSNGTWIFYKPYRLAADRKGWKSKQPTNSLVYFATYQAFSVRKITLIQYLEVLILAYNFFRFPELYSL